MPRCAEVLLPRPIDHAFHYEVADDLAERARVGARAVVPFGHELLTGVITAVDSPPPARMARQGLRPITQIVDDPPLLAAGWLELLRWTATYYAVPWGDVLKVALPPALLPEGERRYQLGSAPMSARPGALARQIVQLLQQHPRGLTRMAMAKRLSPEEGGPAPSGLDPLLRRLALKNRLRVTWRLNPLSAIKLTENDTVYPTYIDSNTNMWHIKSHYCGMTQLLHTRRAPHFHVMALGGEGQPLPQAPLIAAIAATLDAGRSVLILTPDIGRSEELAGQLKTQLGGPVHQLHSELSTALRARRWLAIAAATAPVVVVGSRSALFVPVPSLGLIIVDEEADPLYKQEERPRLHARDVAVMRAKLSAIPVLLQSRLLSAETYWNCATGKYQRVPTRPAGAPAAPTVDTVLVDLQATPPVDGRLAKPLLQALGERLERHEQSLLFVNRRGYASSLICRDCGHLIQCQSCRIGLAYHSAGDLHELRCRYCGLRMSPPTLCPACRSYRLGPLGSGTQRMTEAVGRLFPAAAIARLDRDIEPAHRSRRDGARSLPPLLADADILVATQLCLSYAPPPRLTLIGVLDAEMDLSRPDFRAEERMLQTLVRLRALLHPELPSSALIIQCRLPSRPALQALAGGAPALFFDAELAQRRELGYPPFSRLAALRLLGRQEQTLLNTAEQLAKLGRRLIAPPRSGVELWGPIPVSSPVKGVHPRWQLLLKVAGTADLQQALLRLKRHAHVARLLQRGTLQIEVDPQ